MVVHCWAYYCSNTSADGFAMYEVPSGEDLRQLWLNQGNTKAEPRGCFYFCEVHFCRSQFVADGILRSDAAPCLFFPSRASQSAPAPVMGHSSTNRTVGNRVRPVIEEHNPDRGTPYGAKAKKKNISIRHSDRNMPPRMFRPSGNSLVNVPDVLNAANWDAAIATTSADRSYLGINSQMAKYSEMDVEERRRDTFLPSPYDVFRGDINLHCEAGYFYKAVGETEGHLTCFYCGSESDNWSVGENPWQRHALTSPSCPFLIQQKGADYVRSVLEEHGPYRAHTITNVTLKLPRPRRDSQYVQKALQMRLDRTAVRTVISNRIKAGTQPTTGSTEGASRKRKWKGTRGKSRLLVTAVKRGVPEFKSIAELVREVNDLPVPKQVLSAATESPCLIGLIQEPVATHEMEEENVTETDLPNEREPTVGDFRKVSQQIIYQLTCKICLCAIVGVIFLPCEHLVSCTSCSPAMIECPLCRKCITATVRANFTNN